MKKKHGFSIFEVIISSTIILTLFGILLSTMIPEIKYSVIGRHIADVQKEGVLVHQKILKDLRETDLNLLTNLTNSGCSTSVISFPTARLGGSGDVQMTAPSPLPKDPLTLADINVRVPSWQGYVIYYVDDSTKTLYRRFINSAVSGRLATTCDEAAGGVKVAEGVDLFRVFSGDTISTTSTPAKGPFRVVVRVNKDYASKENYIEIDGAVNSLVNFSVY